MLVAVLGGLLGILMMIPLRRALIVAQHGFLKYPEGTACAEVLKAGASDESRAAAREGAKAGSIDEATTGGKTIIAGFGVGFFITQSSRFGTWKSTQQSFGPPFEGGSVSIENIGTPRCRLHHRTSHRLNHVCRWCACLPRADSGH